MTRARDGQILALGLTCYRDDNDHDGVCNVNED